MTHLMTHRMTHRMTHLQTRFIRIAEAYETLRDDEARVRNNADIILGPFFLLFSHAFGPFPTPLFPELHAPL